jgi:hypothetical protein
MPARQPPPKWTPPNRDEFGSILQLLLDDAVHASEEAHRIQTPQNFRTFYRTVSAYIEGISYQLKQLALTRYYEGKVDFQADEVLALHDYSFRVLQDGRSETFPSFGNTASSFLMAVRCSAKSVGATYEVPMDEVGYRHFRDLFAARNDITHPKSLAALQITMAQMENASRALIWAKDVVGAVGEVTKGKI